MLFLKTSHDTEHLELNEEGYEEFRSWVVNRSHIIRWERDGLVGIISMEKMTDMLRVWDAYLDLKARGRISEIPTLIHSFAWSDTEDHYQLPSDDGRNDGLHPKANASSPHGRSAGQHP